MRPQSGISPERRLASLKDKLEKNDFVRLIEAHNGLSGLIGENTKIEEDGRTVEFDGFWESSFTDTGSKGMPDAGIVGFDSRIDTIEQILNVTEKPMIVDGDTGRSPAEFEHFVCRLERLGVSGVIIEDKAFPKRNSLDPSAKQTQEEPEEFSTKIRRGEDVKMNEKFMIIARIESLIAGVGVEDALSRAESYIEAGADGIMIHSKKNDPQEILEFAERYEEKCQNLERRPPLVAVPTTYNLIEDRELSDHGFDIIIHANHLLRSAHKAMKEVSETILLNNRSFEADSMCSPTSEIFEKVGFDWIKTQDRKYSKRQKLSVIIPAAGKDLEFEGNPKALIEVDGKSIIERQLEVVRKSGIRDVSVVRGYESEKFDPGDFDVDYYENPKYEEKHSLHSLFRARGDMEDGFVLVFSDILFNEEIFENLLESDEDIVLLVDESYRYHKDDLKKDLDLVVSKRKRSSYHRELQPTSLVEITSVGKKIDKNHSDYEFVGLAYFSERGAEILKKVYDDCRENHEGGFHESKSFDQASITDIIQEIIDRGFTVYGQEAYKGWMEIHDREDKEKAEEMVKSL